MTSSSVRSGAGFLGLAIAVAACPFLVGPSGQNESLILQAVPTVPPVQVASEGAPEPRPDPIPSVVESGPQEQAAPEAGLSETGLIASHGVASAAPTPDPEMDEVNQYLWSVYQRT